MSRGFGTANARRSPSEYAKSLFNVAVGNAVRTMREQAGMNRRALCDASGVSASTLTNIENGAMACPMFVASAFAEALDCTLDDLCPVMVEEKDAAE